VDKELSFKAVFLGVLMAVVLGAANAYLGMKAGLTVAATFPAAVVAMAALRPFRGIILEENVARTAGSVGEALVAGAIFTIPAFVIAGAWEELHYWESTLIMLIGGLLGVLFIIILRRTLVVESDLPFPESVAAAEIHKAGQGGQTGAGFVFRAMGLAGVWELFKNSNGVHFIADTTSRFFDFSRSTIRIAEQEISYRGDLHLAAPAVSPALMGVGFIVGTRVSAVLFAGAVTGWLVLVPLAIFLNPSFGSAVGSDLASEVWLRQVRPLAVGTMIVAAFYTLYNLRSSLAAGIGKAIKNVGASTGAALDRTEVDVSFRKTATGVGVAAVATFLPFESTAAMFVGGLFRLALDRLLDRRKASTEERVRSENVGTLLSSGLIAGESLMAVALAFVVLGGDFVPAVAALRARLAGITPSYPLGLAIYPVLGYLFVWLPLHKMREKGLASVRLE